MLYSPDCVLDEFEYNYIRKWNSLTKKTHPFATWRELEREYTCSDLSLFLTVNQGSIRPSLRKLSSVIIPQFYSQVVRENTFFGNVLPLALLWGFFISKCKLFPNLNVGTIIILIFLLWGIHNWKLLPLLRAQLSIQGIQFISNKKDYSENELGNKTVKVFLNVNVHLLLEHDLKKLEKVWNISQGNTIPYLKLLLQWVISHSGYISFKT